MNVFIRSETVEPGDEFITPGTRLPYRVLAISDFVHSDVRGWERIGACVWLDNDCRFTAHFSQRGFWTWRDANETVTKVNEK